MRTEKQFFAITEWNTIQVVTGLSTQHSNIWWVPSLGFSMTEGYSIFSSENEAKNKLKSDIRAKINKLQLDLDKLS